MTHHHALTRCCHFRKKIYTTPEGVTTFPAPTCVVAGRRIVSICSVPSGTFDAYLRGISLFSLVRENEDLNRKTAAGILSKPVEEVVKADRQLAKSANFGLLYGRGPEGFRAYTRTNYGITLSLEEATEFSRIVVTILDKATPQRKR